MFWTNFVHIHIHFDDLKLFQFNVDEKKVWVRGSGEIFQNVSIEKKNAYFRSPTVNILRNVIQLKPGL